MTVYAEDSNNSETFNLTDLPSLELDELLATDVQVTSAMKRLQNMSETAASIYVLTNKEIMQSGVTSVAQALKLVPGMQVRQIDNNQWAITSRSPAGRFSSKLLVLVDGQSIYNPGFAGVYWEALNLPLYDIDRIEVIRGSGGLLWGSNATNGVINIISKHTSDTRGYLAQVEAGDTTDYKVNFRAGGDLANYSSFRVFGSVDKTDEANDISEENGNNTEANDYGKTKNIGGRVDLNINDDVSLLVQTEYSKINMGQVRKVPNLTTYQREYTADEYTRDHFQVMSRLEHRLSADSNQMLQASVSYQAGEQVYYDDRFVISDIDYQMNTLIKNTQFDWGLNYRYTDISVPDNDYISTDITHTVQYGGFVQAQFNLIPDKLKLIIGNRSESNTYTGWEHQPMGRILWQLNDNHIFWASLSQGVRIPSVVEYDSELLVTTSLPVKTVLVGSASSDAETSFSKDIGYRYTDNSWAFDASLFHTKSKDVLVIDEDIDYTTGTLYFNLVSNAELTTYGGEMSLKWQPLKELSMELGYSFTSYKYDLEPGTQASIGYDSILRQVIGKVNYAITPKHSLFAMYHIENGEAYDTDDYSVLDISWNWKATSNVSLSLTGNNLLYGKHIEYNNTGEVFSVPTYIEPSYVARLTVEF
jgi:iron complex outermembrane receptor protein